jgi:hypothetical protein
MRIPSSDALFLDWPFAVENNTRTKTVKNSRIFLRKLKRICEQTPPAGELPCFFDYKIEGIRKAEINQKNIPALSLPFPKKTLLTVSRKILFR